MSVSESGVETHVARVTAQFGRSIAQVLKATDRGTPDPVGSGVLLAVGERRFLLTAAHVLDHHDHSTLYLAVDGGKTVEVGGRSISSGVPSSGRRSEDGIDVGVVELNAEARGALPPEAFLSPLALDINEVADPKALYVVMGYPHRRVELRPGNVIESTLQKYTAQTNDDLYNLTSRDETTNLVLAFRRDRVRFEGLVRTGPHPAGMSGGPVFRLENIGSPLVGGTVARVVGLLTDYVQRNHVLIAPRVSLWVAHLRAAVPDLASRLPAPNRFRPIFREGS